MVSDGQHLGAGDVHGSHQVSLYFSETGGNPGKTTIFVTSFRLWMQGFFVMWMVGA
jgi:hypothetical protein